MAGGGCKGRLKKKALVVVVVQEKEEEEELGVELRGLLATCCFMSPRVSLALPQVCKGGQRDVPQREETRRRREKG